MVDPCTPQTPPGIVPERAKHIKHHTLSPFALFCHRVLCYGNTRENDPRKRSRRANYVAASEGSSNRHDGRLLTQKKKLCIDRMQREAASTCAPRSRTATEQYILRTETSHCAQYQQRVPNLRILRFSL